jgi:hypothetical protein
LEREGGGVKFADYTEQIKKNYLTEIEREQNRTEEERLNLCKTAWTIVMDDVRNALRLNDFSEVHFEVDITSMPDTEVCHLRIVLGDLGTAEIAIHYG